MAVGEPVLNIVDSTMLDAGLTKIANAIRTKGGTSAQLAFPDGMADAIAAIESGTDTLFGRYWEYGTITPATDITSEYKIVFSKTFPTNINLNASYTIFVWRIAPNSYTAVPPNYSWLWQVTGTKQARSVFAYGQYISGTGSVTNATYSGIVGNNSYSNYYTINCSEQRALIAGETYGWIAVGEQEI